MHSSRAASRGGFCKGFAKRNDFTYSYVIVDTGQHKCFSNTSEIIFPQPGEAFYGQDAQSQANTPSYRDNGDGTVTDLNTGLMWQQDPGGKMTYGQALRGASTFRLAGYTDWRLPNAKELQSIVDYTRSPATTNSAAIDPFFSTSEITNEGGAADYPFFWSSTTHANFAGGRSAVYIGFGRGLGWMRSPMGDYQLLDVHGAGTQRSDPKIGNPDDFPYGRGPQGDVIRIFNYVRCVREHLSRKAGG